ncbi:MAG: cation:proton antiporter [Rhodopila sp.]
MISPFDLFTMLLLIAMVICVVNDHALRLPRPVALLLGSIAIAGVIIAGDALFGSGDLRERLRQRVLASDWPEVMLNLLLALLLFAGSLHVDMHALRSRAWTVLSLATGSVVLTTALFGVGFYAALRAIGVNVPLAWCLVIGAILAPTDAVAVEGLLSKVALTPRLRAVISGESLFNDGAAVVLFTTALSVTGGNTSMLGHGRLLEAITVEVMGGAALGTVAGYITYRAVRWTADNSLALMISLTLVLSTYRGAMALHVSGPIAVVTAGLVFGYALNELQGPTADRLRASLSTLWSLVDDALNTILYMLMGLVALAVDLHWHALLAIAIAVPLALVARLISVAIPLLLLDLHVPGIGRAIGVVTWAGLRGGVSIALALIIPISAYRDLLLTICFGVVIFTVIVQGLSLPRLITALYDRPEQALD